MFTVVMLEVGLGDRDAWCATSLSPSSAVLSCAGETRRLEMPVLRLCCHLCSVLINFEPHVTGEDLEGASEVAAIFLLLLPLLLPSIVTEALDFLLQHHQGSQRQAPCTVIVRKLNVKHPFCSCVYSRPRVAWGAVSSPGSDGMIVNPGF